MNQLLAEKSLYEFVLQAWPHIETTPFIDNWHIRAICEHLEAVSRGQITNLLINVPSGLAKSLIVSVFWPAWEWVNDPTVSWLCASYDQHLSTRDAVRCRALIDSAWYQGFWSDRFQFAADQNQKMSYQNTAGGWRLATSTGGRGTGEHPSRIVVDDPHNVKGAESETERQAVRDWWDLTVSTRGVTKDVRRVVIMQRLHERDLSGHILERGGFEHICLPMRYEPGRMKPTVLGWSDPRQTDGELLAKQQFPEAKVREMEIALGSYGTAGQLQQRPAPRTGGLFQREWFQILDAVPALTGRYWRIRRWDLAASLDGDYTCGVRMLRMGEGLWIVEDIVRGRWLPKDRDQAILQTAKLDGTGVMIGIEEEGGSAGKSLSYSLITMLAGFAVHAKRPTGSKEVRAAPLSAQCEVGNVKLLRGPWNAEFLEEMAAFPRGAHDDIVDATSVAFNDLCEITLGAYIPGDLICSGPYDDPYRFGDVLTVKVCDHEITFDDVESDIRPWWEN